MMVTLHFEAADLKARIDCQSLARRLLGDTGKRSGRAVMYSHPGLHRQQQTPSFAVYSDGYTDFATGDHGDLFGLIMLATGCDYHTALSQAADFTGMNTDTPVLHIVKAGQLTQQPRQTNAHWRTRAAQEVTHTEAYLWGDTPDARDVLTYLHDVRGLTDKTIRAARLGYNPDFQKTGITKDDGKTAYLLPGITIPWYDPDSRIVAVRVRCRVGNLADTLGIEPDTNRNGKPLPKYASLSGSIMTGSLYGTIRAACDVLLVEGEFDALIGQQNALPDVCVVTLGSASGSLSPACRDTLTAAPRVVLALDTDAAGQKAAARLTETLRQANMYRMALPEGVKDITDALIAGHTLSDLLETTTPIVQPDAVPSAADALHAHKPLTQAARFALLNIAEPFALLAELIGQTGIGVDRPATIAEFVAASDTSGAGLSDRTIRRSVAWAVEQGVIDTESHRVSEQKEGVASLGLRDNNLGGRPETAYQLADVSALRGIFRQLAEQLAVKRRFADQGIVPTLRADVLATYADSSDTDAEGIAVKLHTNIQDQIDAQPGYQNARQRAHKDVKRHLLALARLDGDKPLGVPYPTLKAYRQIVLRRFVVVHDGEQLSRAYLARLVNSSVRRVIELLESAGIASEHAEPIVQIMSVACARVLAARVISTGRAAFDFEIKAYPVVLTVGSERIELTSDALVAAGHVLAAADGKPVSVEYRGADIRHIAALPERRAMPNPVVTSPVVSAVHPSTPEPTLITDLVAPGASVTDTSSISRSDRQWAIACEKIVLGWLAMASPWRVVDGRLRNINTGETLLLTRPNVLALLQGHDAPDGWPESLSDAERPCELHSAACLTERATRIAGHVEGMERAEYMAALSNSEPR